MNITANDMRTKSANSIIDDVVKKKIISIIENYIQSAASRGEYKATVNTVDVSFCLCDGYYNSEKENYERLYSEKIQIFIDELEEAGFKVTKRSFEGLPSLDINWE